MDAICAIAVAYMWESSTFRADVRLRVFYVRRAAAERIPERKTGNPRIPLCGDIGSTSRRCVFSPIKLGRISRGFLSGAR